MLVESKIKAEKKYDELNEQVIAQYALFSNALLSSFIMHCIDLNYL